MSAARISVRILYNIPQNTYIAHGFFKHEDEGAAPKLAQRLLHLASAEAPV